MTSDGLGALRPRLLGYLGERANLAPARGLHHVEPAGVALASGVVDFASQALTDVVLSYAQCAAMMSPNRNFGFQQRRRRAVDLKVRLLLGLALFAAGVVILLATSIR